MEVLSATIMILCIIPATSYGWGMRGTTIGGEKGAMLPGAIIGAVLAWFSGIYIVQEHFYVFSALGAISMYFGGAMTYGETLAFSMSARPAENMKKGLLALFVKGFLWFGSFGCIFSTGVNAICGKYRLYELIVLFIVTPLSSIAFYFLFNKPFSVDDNKYPRIYFSKSRQESWGAILGIILPLLITGIIKRDLFSVIFSLCCACAGGIGWILGQGLQIYSKHYAEESESVLGRFFSESRGAEAWKEMECVLGAFGGLGAAIGFILTFSTFRDTVFQMELNGGLKPFSDTFSLVGLIIWVILILADMVHYFINKPITKDELKALLKSRKITKEVYAAKLIRAVDTVPKSYINYKRILEPSEFLIYAAFPFVMICLGSDTTASVMSYFMVFWVLAQEVAFEKKMSILKSIILKVTLSLLGAIFLILNLFFEYKFNFIATMIMYTVIYEVLTFIWIIPESIEKLRDKLLFNEYTGKLEKRSLHTVISRNGTFLVHSYFIICIIVVLSILI